MYNTFSVTVSKAIHKLNEKVPGKRFPKPSSVSNKVEELTTLSQLKDYKVDSFRVFYDTISSSIDDLASTVLDLIDDVFNSSNRPSLPAR